MTETTTVIYNADCPICSREIEGYRRYSQRRDLPIRFQPLAEADLAAWDLTPEAAARRLYVIRSGTLLQGGAAFRAMWAAMPRFAWLACLTGLPGVRTLVDAVYDHLLAPALYALHRRRVRRAGCG
jgi:predicted DCC family thiol-disulfide oxidoreductase YuxK